MIYVSRRMFANLGTWRARAKKRSESLVPLGEQSSESVPEGHIYHSHLQGVVKKGKKEKRKKGKKEKR